jgi:type II secretion system protein C
MLRNGWLLVVVAALTFAFEVRAQNMSNFLVLGVIASSKGREGVALLKDMNSQKTFAVREGTAFCTTCTLSLVGRKYIDVTINTKVYKLKVGDDTASAIADAANRMDYMVSNAEKEIRKDGNTVEVSSAYKEHLINADLSKILMQAAAVPQYENGRLKGFQLWDIEPQSVFEMAGLKDGDLITSINGAAITDVGMTIRQLNSLRNAPEATFNFVRNGTAQELKIVVQ